MYLHNSTYFLSLYQKEMLFLFRLFLSEFYYHIRLGDENYLRPMECAEIEQKGAFCKGLKKGLF